MRVQQVIDGGASCGRRLRITQRSAIVPVTVKNRVEICLSVQGLAQDWWCTGMHVSIPWPVARR